MNPAIKLLLVFLIAFEISFITNITLNVVIIVACLAYLIWKRVNIKTVATFLIPFNY